MFTFLLLGRVGVESAEPDLKSSQVVVKGAFNPQQLVEYVYKRTGKHAAIVKQEPEKKEKEEAKDGNKEEKKGDGGGGGGEKASKGEEENKEKKQGNEGKAEAAPAAPVATEEEVNKVVELQKNPYYYYPLRYPMEYSHQGMPWNVTTPPIFSYEHPTNAYPPQMFSDENPNACSVM